MKSSKRFLNLGVAGAALCCGLLLLWNSLSSSDFPRGMWRLPNQEPGTPFDSSAWQDLEDLGVNLAWNYGGVYQDLGAYMNLLQDHGMRSVLKITGAANPPNLLFKYSASQYKMYEFEMDTTLDELLQLWNGNGTGYYFFNHPQGERIIGQPADGASWHLSHAQNNSCWLVGPRFTPSHNYLSMEWKVPSGGSKAFKHRISVRANVEGLSGETPVFKLVLEYLYRYWQGTTACVWGLRADSIEIEAQDVLSSETFQQFSLPAQEGVGATIEYEPFPDTTFLSLYYRLYWYDNCDLWIDGVETMDMDLGYPFYYTQDGHQDVLEQIYDEAQDVYEVCEGAYPGGLTGFLIIDNPGRIQFTACGDISDTLLQGSVVPPLASFAWNRGLNRRFDHFVVEGHPGILQTFTYPLQLSGWLGKQSELDTLAEDLKRARKAAGDTLEWRFKGQAHRDTTANEQLRNPTYSEIMVQGYMALAHGARGMGFYGYTSTMNSSGYYYVAGLVDNQFAHVDTPFVEKWNAVHEVYAMLDSMGGTLLDLVRDTAFCVYPNNSGFKLPITDVYFTDDTPGQDYIEVGQFHLPPSISPDYLVVVNRRTNADRHITVKTNVGQVYALRDIYTQEQFISSTGDFEWIPFDSGQGRVFKLESFDGWQWGPEDNIVLADTVQPLPPTDCLVRIEAGAVIKATAAGLLLIQDNNKMVCNGAPGNPVIFTSLEVNMNWKGLHFYDHVYQAFVDTLAYTKVEWAGNPAIKVRNGRNLYMNSCEISHGPGDGINCADGSLVLLHSSVSNFNGFGIMLDNSDAIIYGDSIMYNDNLLTLAVGMCASSSSVAKIGDCRISHNYDGLLSYGHGTILIMLRNDVSYPLCGHNYFEDNYLCAVDAYDESWPLLGWNGSNRGLNSFCSNGYPTLGYDINNYTGNTIRAQFNYWGHAPVDSQFFGPVDSSNWLEHEPDFFGGSGFAAKQPESGICGGNILAEAYRLNNVAIELFLDGEYYTAIDTFSLVLNEFPGTSPARFALDHIVVCYREAEDYQGAVAFLNAFLQPPTDPPLVPLALYHKVLNLARLQEYPNAIAIAGNMQVIGNWEANLLEPTLIELGMMLKYGLDNVASGDSVFQQFLNQYPESPLAPIAAMELGVAWGGSGIYGGQASASIMVAEPPAEFRLYQNHPNPFNPTTILRYQLPLAGRVNLQVYDICGRLVVNLLHGWRNAGFHELTWDATNLASGIYFYRLEAGDFSDVKKMMLVK